MKDRQYKGVIVPTLTPLNPNETVDKASLRRLVNYLLDNGVHGIWAAGTTGEFAALADGERIACIETIVDEVAGRVPVIGNISAVSTSVAVSLGQALKDCGLDAVAATPPYYYSCAQDELLDHYRYIRERVGLPLWVYNIPIFVKTVVDPETVVELAGEGTIEGIKDSSGAGELLAQLDFLCRRDNIRLWSFLGSLFRIATARGAGAHGVIPGYANLVPAFTVRAWQEGEDGKTKSALDYQARVVDATRIGRLAKGGSMSAAGFSGMKSALKAMGILDHDTVTRPLRSLTDEEKQAIPGILRELDLQG